MATQSARTAVPRTYDSALHLLARLQSNKVVTSLFAAPPGNKSSHDLNALAMPEMLAWLRRAGRQPSDLARLRCIHVAGTKGKGSVSTLIAAVLTAHPSRAAGKVGTYTSPHIASVRERIAIDGQPVSRALFARYFHDLWDRLTEAAREAGDQIPADAGGLEGPSTKPFYFRFLTLLAFHIFLEEGVTSAVIECGIGGEYDPTNVLTAEAVTVAVVTQIGIDHVAMLGDTADKIAWHKAGIFKSGVPAVTRRLGSQGEAVTAVMRARAAEKGATLVEVSDEPVDVWGGLANAKLQGPFQKYNMALAAVAARRHLLKLGVEVEGAFGQDETQLAQMPAYFVTGLQSAAPRGRSEHFRDEVGIDWYLDGAHTHDSLTGVGQWFASQADAPDTFRILVFNQQDRDAPSLLRALLEGCGARLGIKPFHEAIFTRNEEVDAGIKDLSVQEACAEAMQNEFQVTAQVTVVVPQCITAVRELAKKAQEHGKPVKILATGSFGLVGPIIRNIDSVED